MTAIRSLYLVLLEVGVYLLDGDHVEVLDQAGDPHLGVNPTQGRQGLVDQHRVGSQNHAHLDLHPLIP